MKKTSLILVALALGACSSPKDPSYEHPASANREKNAPVQSGSGAPVVSQGSPTVVTPSATPPVVVVPAQPALRPGLGRVEAVMASSAAAGGTVASSAYRLHIRMDDGTMQYADQATGDFRVGDRVEITREGRIVRR